MTADRYHAIVVGSGAGGAAVAYKLANNGKRVLVLEKGDYLPRDGSTLDVKQVFESGRFKGQVPWLDNRGREFVPGEFYNVGGKTKWYGAALLRFDPREFAAEPAYQALPWPITYDDLAPYYAEAEELLHVNCFENEAELRALIDRLIAAYPDWRVQALPLGLKKEILGDPLEARHFDGFASVRGYKADAEWNLLHKAGAYPGFELLCGKEVVGLTHDRYDPAIVTGVRCADGSTYGAPTVVLAAGAMTSPRILQDDLAQTGLDNVLACAAYVGTNFKLHINSAVVAISPFKRHDLLRKTAIFFNENFPHSSVQCLGWLDGEILGAQLPARVPPFVAKALGERAVGFFAVTEDGSSIHNRVVSGRVQGGLPMLDYDLNRLQPSLEEHRAVVRAFEIALRKAGMISVSRYTGLAGTAHALGSLVMGADPRTSVVDREGRVHGMQGLYVADASVLPRAGRVNPALTVYAWGLRLGEHLGHRIHP